MHGTRRQMGIVMRIAPALVGAALVGAAAAAAEPGDLADPIDLSTFGDVGGFLDGPADRQAEAGVPIEPVGFGGDQAATRVYVSGIVGASFATVTTGGSNEFLGTTVRQVGSVNETIFTGGGAVGMAFARQSGLLRMEIEGRARGPMIGQSALVAEGEQLPLDVNATNGWSTTTNFWRDYFFTRSLGMYAGGGFGVGGYRYAINDVDQAQLTGSGNVTTFAWQVGTGVVYQINDRITIDTGYRYFALTPAVTSLAIAGGAEDPVLGIGDFTSAFSASELLVSIRIYEPFRNWR